MAWDIFPCLFEDPGFLHEHLLDAIAHPKASISSGLPFRTSTTGRTSDISSLRAVRSRGMSKCLGRCQGNSDQKQRSSQAQGEAWTERGEVGGKVMEDRRLRAQGHGEASAVGGRGQSSEKERERCYSVCVWSVCPHTPFCWGRMQRSLKVWEKDTCLPCMCPDNVELNFKDFAIISYQNVFDIFGSVICDSFQLNVKSTHEGSVQQELGELCQGIACS